MVIKKTRDFLGGNKPILSGVLPFSANDAILQAQEAQSAGANGYVIFPPPGLGGGASNTVEAPLKFFETITTNVDIPASVFQYPINTGFGYSTDALKEIAMLPGVIAIKEGSNCILAYEENFRTIKNEGADIAFLPSNFNWFLAQLAVGADGLLSG